MPEPATPPGIGWTDDRLPLAPAGWLPVRIYRHPATGRAAPLVLHLHGGAFCQGSLDSGRVVAQLLAEAGAVVVSADYPLAPAHPFPQALHLAYAALQWLHSRRTTWVAKAAKLFVAGEEAGGNLAAALALIARDQHIPPLAGQILLSPMLDPCLATKSIRQADAGPVGCQWADGWHQYLGSADKASHPYAAPLGSVRLAGLAPALVVTAADDPMHDESLGYARRLRDSGVAVQEHVIAGVTRWPTSLLCPDAGSASAPDLATGLAPGGWAAELRQLFTRFFLEQRALRRAAPRPESIEAAPASRSIP